MTRARDAALSLALLGVPLLVLGGCRSRVAALRDALRDGDAAQIASAADLPACSDPSCLDSIARALGSTKGFDSNDPDQASAAAVALVIARDRRGDLIPAPDRWIAAMKQARGPGADALRLAVVRGMADVAPRLGKRLEAEAETATVMHDAAGVLPGACAAYVTPGAPPPGTGKSYEACVARDLERVEGEGVASAQAGLWRAAAAEVGLWKDVARALRQGAGNAEGAARTTLETELAVVEAATAKIELKGPAPALPGPAAARP